MGDHMEFRGMRRKDRQVFDDLITEILEKGEYGILSVHGENGYPYGVPLNYAYFDGSIYFHCTKTGHKLDAIKSNDKVSFCVVSETGLIPEKFSTKYKSVIAFGKAAFVSGEEKTNALMALIFKYSAEYKESGRDYVKKEQAATEIVKIKIDHITGKARL
jgi:nitroimidazol reductase NimA-like FMN-containing flavoprotein (pyridoxamine 5'-phosphate oxidase superfamily)